jgi:hypothetical protein
MNDEINESDLDAIIQEFGSGAKNDYITGEAICQPEERLANAILFQAVLDATGNDENEKADALAFLVSSEPLSVVMRTFWFHVASRGLVEYVKHRFPLSKKEN